jgi:hypothetical protein
MKEYIHKHSGAMSKASPHVCIIALVLKHQLLRCQVKNKIILKIKATLSYMENMCFGHHGLPNGIAYGS